MLHTREHVDSRTWTTSWPPSYGRISNWLAGSSGNLPHIGRVHVNRWGDGSAHFHVWFFARPARIPGCSARYVVEWDEVLPPVPEDVWRADLHTVATKLANWGGHARA